MAKTQHKPVKSAKAAKKSARAKPVARAAAPAARKTGAKPAAKKPIAAKKVAVKKPVKSAKPAKAASKPVSKAASKKMPAKKAAPAKSVKKVTKPNRAKTPTPGKKTLAVKSVAQKKAPPTSSLKAKPIISHAAENSRKFVTNRKPEISATAKSGKPKAPPSENGVTMQDGRYVLPATVTIQLPHGYKPSSKEGYMGPRQLQYFRNKLSQWRGELVEESRQTIESLRDEVRDVGDEAERATRETENSLELRTRDRYRKLIAKIDKALKRIEDGRYGFCEETDEDIGIDRLDARPIATLSLDAQERWEHRQKQMGD